MRGSTTRRMAPSVPAVGSAPLAGVGVTGGALAVHRPTQTRPQADAFVIHAGVDEAVLAVGFVLPGHVLPQEQQLGTERSGLLLCRLRSFEGSGQLVPETAVFSVGLRGIAALARESQLRLRVLRLGVRVA